MCILELIQFDFVCYSHKYIFIFIHYQKEMKCLIVLDILYY